MTDKAGSSQNKARGCAPVLHHVTDGQGRSLDKWDLLKLHWGGTATPLSWLESRSSSKWSRVHLSNRDRWQVSMEVHSGSVWHLFSLGHLCFVLVGWFCQQLLFIDFPSASFFWKCTQFSSSTKVLGGFQKMTTKSRREKWSRFLGSRWFLGCWAVSLLVLTSSGPCWPTNLKEGSHLWGNPGHLGP